MQTFISELNKQTKNLVESSNDTHEYRSVPSSANKSESLN